MYLRNVIPATGDRQTAELPILKFLWLPVLNSTISNNAKEMKLVLALREMWIENMCGSVFFATLALFFVFRMFLCLTCTQSRTLRKRKCGLNVTSACMQSIQGVNMRKVMNTSYCLSFLLSRYATNVRSWFQCPQSSEHLLHKRYNTKNIWPGYFSCIAG